MGKMSLKIVARGVTYVVFLLPVALSLAFGGAVLGQVLQEPDRTLDLWQFGSSTSSTHVQILGLQSQYMVSEPVAVQVRVSNTAFDCGDLYITIRDSATGDTFTQSGYFDQCFAASSLALPIGDEFSEIVDKPGSYFIDVEVIDKLQTDSILATYRFSVV